MIIGLFSIERNHVLHLMNETEFNTRTTTYKLLGIPIFKLVESLEIEDSIDEPEQIGF